MDIYVWTKSLAHQLLDGVRSIVDGNAGKTSSVIGGGDNSYSNLTPDFTIVTIAASNTLSINNAPFNITAAQLQSGVLKVNNEVVDLLGATLVDGIITVPSQTSDFVGGELVVLTIQGGYRTEVANVKSSYVTTTNPKIAYVTSESPLATVDLTSSYANLGSPICVKDRSAVGLYVSATIGQSENVELKLVGVSIDGSEYEIDALATTTLWTTTALGFSSTYHYFEVGTLDKVQVKVKAGTVGATAGSVTVRHNSKLL